MKKIIVFFILLIILIYSYKDKQIINSKKNDKQVINIKKTDIVLNNEKSNLIKVSYNDDVLSIDFEDYVIGVVSCEMPASFELEALKALAVAARTYAMYKLDKNDKYVMKSSTSDQCYYDIAKLKDRWGKNFDKYYNKIKDAVYSTKGQYMTYNDEIIISFYFSISNGYTEDCENVFTQKLNYLKSVDSSWDKKYNYKEKSVQFTTKEFLSNLGLKDSKIYDIDILRNDANRVKSLTINNNTFKGTKVRSLLKLRSTDFDIRYDDNNVYITTKGFGHGVGLSQYGANSMAISGFKYDEILKHYYSGIKIMNN